MYDLVLQFSFGLLSPVFAIFVLKQVPGSTLSVIGTAAACYWIARATTTVPLSRFMDRTDGERDEYYFLIFGTLVISFVPLMFMQMTQSWHLYLIQLISGFANSMAVPGWRVLFMDHIDKGSTAFEWSLDDIVIGLAIAASAYIGAQLVEGFGYGFVLALISGMSFISVCMLIPLRSKVMSLAQLRRDFGWRQIFRRRHAPRSRAASKIRYGAV